MESRLTDPEHAEAHRRSIFDRKIVIKNLPVPEIPTMDIRAWYVYLPCGASYYIGKWSTAKFQQAIDRDEHVHQMMRERATRRSSNGRR